MQPGFFVVVATYKCIRVAGSHMVYSRRERFVFCSCRWVVKDVRMFWSYPHHNISGAGHVPPVSRIKRGSASFLVLHYRRLRKFRRSGSPDGYGVNHCLHYFFNPFLRAVSIVGESVPLFTLNFPSGSTVT